MPSSNNTSSSSFLIQLISEMNTTVENLRISSILSLYSWLLSFFGIPLYPSVFFLPPASPKSMAKGKGVAKSEQSLLVVQSCSALLLCTVLPRFVFVFSVPFLCLLLALSFLWAFLPEVRHRWDTGAPREWFRLVQFGEFWEDLQSTDVFPYELKSLIQCIPLSISRDN